MPCPYVFRLSIRALLPIIRSLILADSIICTLIPTIHNVSESKACPYPFR